jgi:hypothetical protein
MDPACSFHGTCHMRLENGDLSDAYEIVHEHERLLLGPSTVSGASVEDAQEQSDFVMEREMAYWQIRPFGVSLREAADAAASEQTKRGREAHLARQQEVSRALRPGHSGQETLYQPPREDPELERMRRMELNPARRQSVEKFQVTRARQVQRGARDGRLGRPRQPGRTSALDGGASLGGVMGDASLAGQMPFFRSKVDWLDVARGGAIATSN